MNRYRVRATVEVDYHVIVEAKNKEEAWSIANEETDVTVQWKETYPNWPKGDWPLDNIIVEEEL
jgi:hypothetical protein|tara:strand:- start:1769 stop:1960 length:192 start_codon:yes stop_codon:yes gene_type:complete